MTSNRSSNRRDPAADRGTILPLVLVVAVVLSVVVLALARFVTTDLRYAQVAEERAERQASATSAITYGVERIRLGQTLCGSSAGDFGTITPGLIDNNETTTALTCSRFGAGLSDITGWAIVMTGEGISTNLLEVKGGGTKTVTGPMFIDDVDEVDFQGVGPALDHTDGDLWHHRATCPGAAPSLPATYNFIPADARGPACTTSTWDQIVTAPALPALGGSLTSRDGSYTLDGACRVFEPGHYTAVPDVGTTDSYFRSGLYHFDGIGVFDVRQQSIWFGHPGGADGSEFVGNATCENAKDNDPDTGGAVAYMSGNSRFTVSVQGQMEFFPRVIDGKRMSLQEVEAGSGYNASTVTAASGTEIVYIGNGNNKDLVFRGLVYAPNAWFAFDNASNTAQQKLLGGAVVSRMTIQASASATGFEISVATAPFESDLVLTATSTSDVSGAQTVIQAVVEYRVDEPDPDQRVAINSLRVLNP